MVKNLSFFSFKKIKNITLIELTFLERLLLNLEIKDEVCQALIKTQDDIDMLRSKDDFLTQLIQLICHLVMYH